MKKGFTLQQHKNYGIELQNAHDLVVHLSCATANCYGISSKVAKRADKAAQAISLLKSELDNRMYAENDATPDMTTIYYGAQFLKEMAKSKTVNKIENT